MGEVPQNREQGVQEAIRRQELSPDTLALNFFEETPVNKLIYTVTPTPWDIRLTKVSYSFGSLDLSANGYIQLVASRVLNPNIYGTLEQNSNILFSKMGGANRMIEGDSYFSENVVVQKNEPIYWYLISNIPLAEYLGNRLGVVGRVALYYSPLFK